MRSLGESWAEVAWERAGKGTWPGFFIVLRRRAWGTCVVWISFTHQRRDLVISLSWCGHKGQRDRIVLQAVSHQRSSGIRLLIVLINPLPQNSSPRWRLAFLSLGFKANHSGDYCTGRGPTHDRDHALSCNTILLTAVGVDFPYCEAAARGEQVCEALTVLRGWRIEQEKEISVWTSDDFFVVCLLI